MNKRIKFSLILFGLSLFPLLPIQAISNELSQYTFNNVPLKKTLGELGQIYQVRMIVAPGLTGTINQTIDISQPVEKVLGQMLDPFGYSFNKVENYYLVGHSLSPVTIFAEFESKLIPVGFLSRDEEKKLIKYREYVQYDEMSGSVFVKAPPVIMNQILSDVWGEKKTTGRQIIVYDFRIIDLEHISELDLFIDSKYINPFKKDREFVITHDQIVQNNNLSMIIDAHLNIAIAKVIRQPWIAVVPGTTTKFNIKYHYVSVRKKEELPLDQLFQLEITPTLINHETGLVESKIVVGQDGEKNHSVSTVIISKAGVSEVLAVTRVIQSQKMNFAGKNDKKIIRDYAVLVTVNPINVADSLVSELFMVNSNLDGLEPLLLGSEPVEDDPIKKNNQIEIGISSQDNQLYPAFGCQYDIGQNYQFGLNFLSPEHFSLSLTQKIFDNEHSSIAMLIGSGVGPDEKDALMLGFSDQTSPTEYLTFFGEYYPLVYLYQSNQFSSKGVWLAGTRLGTENMGISFNALGDSHYRGKSFVFDWKTANYLWLIEYNEMYEDKFLSIKGRYHF